MATGETITACAADEFSLSRALTWIHVSLIMQASTFFDLKGAGGAGARGELSSGKGPGSALSVVTQAHHKG